MKIVVVGATGVIGSAVVRALAPRHEVIGASRQLEPKVDLEQPDTIAALFRKVTGIDAIVCCAGNGVFKPLLQLTDGDFEYSMKSKLMGQVNLIRAALQQVKDNGSITVTTGLLSQKPMPGGAALSLVNSGLEGFVRGAALEAPRGLRVNAVSPPWVKETLQALKMDLSQGLWADEVAKAYVAAVEGKHQGEAIDPSRLK